ncbi:hypothetical protein OIV83_000103 [Microbotryomycetes sp. JL201]|nr:hypothetical protein OIV83_000103 [Microbotryomycetes sp. JL201]
MLIQTVALLSTLTTVLASPVLEERATSLKGSAVTWKIPTGRPWDDSLDSVGPCGGAAQGARENFPLTGGRMSVLVRADADDLEINYSTASNPTKNSEFKMAIHGFTNTTSPDFYALGLKAGDQVTLQTKWRAGVKNTILYSCADVTLVESANYVSTTPCIEGALEVATVDSEDYSDAQANNSGLSTASAAQFTKSIIITDIGQKAGIGAGVGVAGVLIISALAYFLYRRGKQVGEHEAQVAAYGGISIDGRTLGDIASFHSRDMSQKASA